MPHAPPATHARAGHRPSRPAYLRVLRTFVRNSLIREMQFRGNFLLELATNALWFGAQLVFFSLIFGNVPTINGWSRDQYFGFMATGMIINALIEAFFMPNCANLSELVRTGNLDFALLKPIDTQFLVSFEKLDLGALCHLALPLALLGHALARLARPPSAGEVAMYLLLLVVGVAFFYSLMLAMASTSVWLGRNQALYEFWFYITIFARYPRDIYRGSVAGNILRTAFSYVLPILLVVTVPADLLIRNVFDPRWLGVSMTAAILGLAASRAVFHQELKSYRSASS